MGTFKGWVNPLQLLDVDEPWASKLIKEPPTLESMVDFACTPGVSRDVESLVERYREISTEKKRVAIAPVEERILDKLIWPLRHAKASYMFGNYLGTVALCGMVAEMVATLLWDIAEITINGRPMTKQDQEALFGSGFERLGQDRRVSVLKAYGVVSESVKNDFDVIRATRRHYLHLWSQDHERLPGDAVSTTAQFEAVPIRPERDS